MKSDIFEVRTSEDQAFCNSLHVLIPASWAQWTVLRSIFRFFDEDRDGFLSYEDTKPAETDHQNMGPYGPRSPALRKHLASNPLSPISAFHHSQQELAELWRATKKEDAAELTAPLFQGACAQARPGGSVAVAG